MAIAFLYSGESRYAEKTEKDLIETLRSLFEARGIETEFTLQVVVSWHKDGVSHFVCEHEENTGYVHACDHTDHEIIVAFRTGTTTNLQFASLIFPEDSDEFIELGESGGKGWLHRRIFNILTGEDNIRPEEPDEDSVSEESSLPEASKRKIPAKRVSKKTASSTGQSAGYFGPLTQGPENSTSQPSSRQSVSEEKDYLSRSRAIILKKLSEMEALEKAAKAKSARVSEEMESVESDSKEFSEIMDNLGSASPNVRAELARTASENLLSLTYKKKKLEAERTEAEKLEADCIRACAKLKEALSKVSP